ncbi:MAG: SPOR domain-containing protein [Sulfurimonas sp.]|nr:SPOR domain-containing protein [Sulfurimonas sp.]
MNDKNELNDIILNKGGSANSNKKIILAVATLGVILIIVVMLMNSLSSNGTDNLPQAALPPEPQAQVIEEDADEPLFEEVEVIEEESNSDANLDAIAQKLKEESMQEEVIVVAPKPVKKIAPKKPVAKKIAVPVVKSTSGIAYYIQVGSFSKYEPNKKFLKSITNLGFDYKFHKVTKNSKTFNKVLVGPFSTSKAAKDARRVIRAKVEPGAFLVKL